MAELAKMLECLPLVRKRFRKGVAWLREPPDVCGGNPLQTTRALELNSAIIGTVIDWMPRQKVGIKALEDQAGVCSIYVDTSVFKTVLAVTALSLSPSGEETLQEDRLCW